MPAYRRSTRKAFHWVYSSRLLIAAGITLLIGALIALLGSSLAIFFTGVSIEQLQDYEPQDLKDPLVLTAFQIIQVSSQIGFFLLPALLIPLFYGKSPLHYLQIKTSVKARMVLISIGFLLLALPFVQLSMLLNQAISFPDFLSGLEQQLRDQHEQVEALTENMIRMPNFGFFLLNVVLIAVLPAVAEEFFFRGFVQNFFKKWSGKVHLAIWVSAFIFSLIHFQFFAFIPRLLLGALFGYMLVYTGNIWYPVIAHFFNNFMLLLITYIYEPINEEWPMNLAETYPYFYQVLVLVFAILLVFTLYQLSKRKGDRERDVDDNWIKVYTTLDRHRAQILKGMLESHDIDAVIMDKRDSAYMAFGEIHIYANEQEASKAKELIQQYEEEEQQKE